MGDFEGRFEDALRKRLFPNAPLHLKEIAGAIGRSENTVARWWRGETHIAADDLYNIARFLFRRGDSRFLSEIFGPIISPQTPELSSAQGILELIKSALAELGHGSATALDAHYWFRSDGETECCPAGLAQYVRRTVNMPESAGDLTAYAMRVLGWIALTVRADGVPIIRHDGRRIASLAAERICEWLADRTDQLSVVRRCVHISGQWIDTQHSGARAAVTAIQKAAFIFAKPRRQWLVKRLSLDDITNPLLKDLLRVYNQNPAELVNSAASLGAFTTSNLFGVKGDDVTSYHVATGFGPGLDARTIVGMNVLSRPDTDYGLMLQARILLTCREGANYHELTGTIDDNHVRYLNLSLPDAGVDGRVLTSTVLLELDRVAA